MKQMADAGLGGLLTSWACGSFYKTGLMRLFDLADSAVVPPAVCAVSH